jgi:hypothetical protein
MSMSRTIAAVGAVLFALAAWSAGCGGGGKGKAQDGGPMPTACRNSLDCPLGTVCDPSIAQCVGCVTANDCPANNDCTARTCVPYTACTNSLDCPKTEVCNTATSRCVACVMDADCADSTKTCVANVCQTKCDSDRTCTPLGLLCDLTSGSCAQCLVSQDCGSGKYCQAGSCIAAVCTPGQTACMLNAIATCDSVGDGYTGTAVPCDPMTCQMGASGASCVGGAAGQAGGVGGAAGGSTGGGGAGGVSGATGTGGAAGAAGAPGTGGATGTGGTTGTGGAAGAPGTGGATGAGGVAGSAGSAGAGGSGIVTCPSAFTATTAGWVLAPAAGGTCWHGYAYNFADSNGTTITPGVSMTYATCGAVCPLTAAGRVTSSTMTNNYVVYAGIGFKINQPMNAMGPDGSLGLLTPTGSGLTFSYTETGGAGVVLRAEISDGVTRWCHNLGSSPSTITYGSFNTACWDSPPDGTPYGKQPINEIQFIVVPVGSAADYDVSLTSVVENP